MKLLGDIIFHMQVFERSAFNKASFARLTATNNFSINDGHLITSLHQSLEMFIIKQKELNWTKMIYKLKAKSDNIAGRKLC